MNQLKRILLGMIGISAFGVGWAIDRSLRPEAVPLRSEPIDMPEMRSLNLDEGTVSQRTEGTIESFAAAVEGIADPRLKPIAAFDWVEKLTPEAIQEFLLSVRGEDSHAYHAQMEDVMTILGRDGDQYFLTLLLNRWVEIDSSHAKAFADEAHSNESVRELAFMIYWPWAKRNPVEANALLASTDQSTVKHALGAGIIAQSKPLEGIQISRELDLDDELLNYLLPVSNAQGEAALARMQQPGSEISNENISKLLELWAQSDPAAVLRASSGIEDDELRIKAEAKALISLGYRDLNAATDALLEMPNAFTDHLTTIESIAPTEDSFDPSLFLDWIKRIPDSSIQEKLAEEHYSRILSKATPETLAEWFEISSTDDVQPERTEQFVLRMATNDPAFTVNWLEEKLASMTPQKRKELDSGRFGGMIAAADIALATAPTTLGALPDGIRSDFLLGVADWFGKNDVDAGRKWIESLPSPIQPDARLSILDEARALAPHQANSFLHQVSDPGERYRLANVLVAKLPPDAALDWIAETAVDREQASLLLSQSPVIPALTNHDPLEALELIAQYSETDAFPELASSLAKEWVRIDPIEATDFLTRLGSGPAQDAALRTAADTFQDTDPSLALEWAAAISDASRTSRLHTVEGILSPDSDYQRTTQEKLQLLEQSPLTEADKEVLVEKLNASARN